MIKRVSKQVRDQRNGVQVLLEKMNPKASAILIYSDCYYISQHNLVPEL